MKFKIYYASGVGGDNIDMDEPQEIEDFKNRDAAIIYAWENACQYYDSYEGLHGVPEMDDEDYEDDRESSVEYDAIPVVDDKVKKVSKEVVDKKEKNG